MFVFAEAVEGVLVTPESIRRLLLVDGVSGENKFLFLPGIGEEGAAKAAANNVWPADDAIRPAFFYRVNFHHVRHQLHGRATKHLYTIWAEPVLYFAVIHITL
jgi:hypothetical protein